MYANPKDSIKNILNSSSSSNINNTNNNNRINQLSSPLQLLLSCDLTRNQDGYIINNLLKFFNIALNENNDDGASTISHLPSDDINATKKVIEYLNFIRFKHEPTVKSPARSNKQTESCDKKIIPSYSIILLTNNAAMNKTTKQIMDNDDALRIVYEQSKINNHHLLRANVNWSYNHKIELNDEFGKTMARQLYFKLNFNNNSNLNSEDTDSLFPLCCRTMWVSPKSSYSQNPSCKYIIRLNINCKNYDLMLFFYRLLFDKCPNYSKKDFSLFVLQQNINQKVNIEFQLSLKNDPNVNVNQLKNASLIYNVPHRSTFDNVTRLLDGFLEEIVKNRVYAVQDPDHNKIFLIDSSNSSIQTNNYFNSVGLAEKYFSIANTLMFQQQQLLNNIKNTTLISQEKNLAYSPNSNTSSSSETHSFDSGRWSCSAASSASSSSTVSPPNNSKNSKQSQQHVKLNENQIFDYNNSNNNLKNNKLENDTSNTSSSGEESNLINNSVKDLIKKFDCSTNKSNNVVNVQNVCSRSSSSRIPNHINQSNQHLTSTPTNTVSSRLLNNLNDESDDYDLELEQLLKRATNNSMHALNEMTIFKNNSNNNNNNNIINNKTSINHPPQNASNGQTSVPINSSSNRSTRNMSKPSSYINNPLYQRSYSVLNEPFKNSNTINSNNYQPPKTMNNTINMNNHLIKSALLNGTSDLFNRKKSKSVTFMDSIGITNDNDSTKMIDLNKTHSFFSNSLLDNNGSAKPTINARYKGQRSNLVIERQRSKSTLPFMCSSSNRYVDSNQYNQMLTNRNYPCFNNNEYDYHGGEDDSSDDEDSSSAADDLANGSDCLLVADVDDDDTYVKIPASHLNKQKEQYKLILQKQQEQLYKQQQQLNNKNNGFMFDFNRNCLIDNQNSRKSNTNLNEQMNKPDVGITARTRFRRSHTLDLLRSTRMPLNEANQYIDNQSFNSNIFNGYTNKYNDNNFIKKKFINTNSLNSNSPYMIKIENQKPPIKV